MTYTKGTFTPNEVFDTWLVVLKPAELRIILFIIRQTIGWKLPNGKRKKRDRISNGQMIQRANVSERNLSPTIQSLIERKLIRVSSYANESLDTPEKRRGRRDLHYECLLSTTAERSRKDCNFKQKKLQKSPYNKRKIPKENKPKRGLRRVGRETDWQRIQYLTQLGSSK